MLPANVFSPENRNTLFIQGLFHKLKNSQLLPHRLSHTSQKCPSPDTGHHDQATWKCPDWGDTHRTAGILAVFILNLSALVQSSSLGPEKHTCYHERSLQVYEVSPGRASYTCKDILDGSKEEILNNLTNIFLTCGPWTIWKMHAKLHSIHMCTFHRGHWFLLASQRALGLEKAKNYMIKKNPSCFDM